MSVFLILFLEIESRMNGSFSWGNYLLMTVCTHVYATTNKTYIVWTRRGGKGRTGEEEEEGGEGGAGRGGGGGGAGGAAAGEGEGGEGGGGRGRKEGRKEGRRRRRRRGGGGGRKEGRKRRRRSKSLSFLTTVAYRFIARGFYFLLNTEHSSVMRSFANILTLQ